MRRSSQLLDFASLVCQSSSNLVQTTEQRSVNQELLLFHELKFPPLLLLFTLSNGHTLLLFWSICCKININVTNNFTFLNPVVNMSCPVLPRAQGQENFGLPIWGTVEAGDEKLVQTFVTKLLASFPGWPDSNAVLVSSSRYEKSDYFLHLCLCFSQSMGQKTEDLHFIQALPLSFGLQTAGSLEMENAYPSIWHYLVWKATFT